MLHIKSKIVFLINRMFYDERLFVGRLLGTEEQLAISEGQITSNLIRLYKALGGDWTPEAPEKEE